MASNAAGCGAAAAKDIKGSQDGNDLEPKAPTSPSTGRPAPTGKGSGPSGEAMPAAWKQREIELPPMDGVPQDQQALAQWLGKALAATAKQGGLADDAEADASKAPPRMLLVSDNLELHELVIKACLDNTMVVPVKYTTWSLQELRDAITSRMGPPAHQFASVGMIDHGKSGQFCLLKCIDGGSIDLEDFKNGKHDDYIDFFKWIAQYVKEPAEPAKWREDCNARIDLMACNTFEGDQGTKLIAYLEELTSVNWTASIDKTGNEDQGYNWVMESDHKVGDISTDYFDKKRLTVWTKCALLPIIAAGAVFVATNVASGACQEVGRQAVKKTVKKCR